MVKQCAPWFAGLERGPVASCFVARFSHRFRVQSLGLSVLFILAHVITMMRGGGRRWHGLIWFDASVSKGKLIGMKDYSRSLYLESLPSLPRQECPVRVLDRCRQLDAVG
jgi:hypothetical protein